VEATNENIAKLYSMLSNQEVKDITPPPPVPAPISPPVTTILSTLQASQIRLGAPNNFDGDWLQGCTFLTSCELYTLLTTSDFPNNQTQIHWALSYCKSRYTATFAEGIVRQEIKTGKMVFTSWTEFIDKFASIFCLGNYGAHDSQI
jgi:hypothetical protein